MEALAADLSNLGSVYRDHGDYAAGLECLEEALQIYEKNNDPLKQAASFHLASNLYREAGDLEKGMHYLQQAMAVSTKYRLVIMQSFHLNSIANIYWLQGKTEECLRLHRQGVELNRKSRYADGLAHSLRMVGETLENLQRSEEALPYLQEAAMRFAQLKDQRSENAMLTKAAAIYEERNDWDETLNILKRLSASSDNRKSSIEILERMAKVCRQKGDSKEAIRYYRDAIDLLEMEGDQNVIATLLNSIAILEWKAADYESALKDYEHALEIFRSLGDDVHAGLILNSIGMTLKSLGRFKQALRMLGEARELNRRTGQRKLEGHSLATIADIQSDLCQTKSAIENYQQALLAKRETMDIKGEAWMLYHLARLQSLEGQSALSEEYMTETERIVSDCGDPKLKKVWKELQRSMKKGEENA